MTRVATLPAGPALNCCPTNHSQLSSEPGAGNPFYRCENGRLGKESKPSDTAKLAGARKTHTPHMQGVISRLNVRLRGLQIPSSGHTSFVTIATQHTCPRPLRWPRQRKSTSRKKQPPSRRLWASYASRCSPMHHHFSYFLRNREASTVCFPSSSSESESEDVEPVSQSSSSSESSESSSSSLEK